jgi:peptidoglycan hydrolase CwlO-like protein
MFSPTEIISMAVALASILFGFSGWRKNDNQGAERLGVIETKLENILDDLKCLISKIDRSDEKFGEIERKMAKFEEQLKTCFTMINNKEK